MTTTTSLSFRPWARDTTEESALKEVLARVNFERGHFRDITEASLQEEIAAAGGLELSESEDEADEEDEGAETGKGNGKPTTREELFKAKSEMLQHVYAAEQDLLMSLDFISLLLSKQAPQQANTTSSQVLKEKVPSGTLGTDLWQRMPVDKAREAQDDLLATSVRMDSLQQSADNLLSAASRLQENVRKETQYWEQILSISAKGWNVCRLPGQHRLAVRFGFSESAPEFSRRGIAALNTDAHGNITLERGVGSKPKVMRVLVKKDGKTVGTSKLPSLSGEGESTLEARIRHARDSLFDEELYHEMIRESRSIASLGVAVEGAAICFKPDTGGDMHAPEIAFELVSLNDVEDHTSSDAPNEDSLAQALALAARLLLTQAHRERLRKRSQMPPPMSDRKEQRPLLPILRPIMSFILHRSAVDQLNAYLRKVQTVLSAAKIDSTVKEPRFDFSAAADITNAEALTRRFMQPWTSMADIDVDNVETGAFTLRVRIDTTLAHNFSSVFALTTQDKRTIRFTRFDELATGADTILASSLARALATMADGRWKCNAREALLTTADGDDGKSRSMWVSYDSANATLSLNSVNKKVVWSVGSETEAKSFRSACDDLLG